jgi:hypothetical protein
MQAKKIDSILVPAPNQPITSKMSVTVAQAPHSKPFHSVEWKNGVPYAKHMGQLIRCSARFNYAPDIRMWLKTRKYSVFDFDTWLSISRPMRPLYTSKGYVEQPQSQEYISLIVRNISKYTTAADIREIFAQYAPVRDVYIPDRYGSDDRRSFAFVEIVNSVQALIAIQEFTIFNRLHNRCVAVELAKGDRKNATYMLHQYAE